MLNTTFARLEAAFARQARFTANAAHELRTPVTIILTRTQNGLASDHPNPEQQAAHGGSIEATSELGKGSRFTVRLHGLAGPSPQQT